MSHACGSLPGKVGADEATALQGGRARNALMRLLRSKAVEQTSLSSPLRILAVADGGTAFVLRRALLFTFLWWVIAEGGWEAWGLGAVNVGVATWAILYPQPPSRRRFSIIGFPGFGGFLLWNSPRGGARVA